MIYLSKISDNRKSGLCRAFSGLVILSVLISGLFLVFWPGSVEAANYEGAYIDQLQFYYDPTDDLIFQFRCKTTFTLAGSANDHRFAPWGGAGIPDHFELLDADLNIGIEPDLVANQFIAGNTYKLYFKYFQLVSAPYYKITKAYWESKKGSAMTAADHFFEYSFLGAAGGGTWTILAYYEERPTLTITYPENNDEIAGPFNIVGTYTIPEASNYTQLWAYLREETIFYLNWFIQDLETKTGAVDIRVSGIPLGDDYNFIFYFKGGGESPYDSGITLNIKILEDIPYELPYTGETPPESFNPLDPDSFYIEHSNYATATPLYTNLTGSLKPIIFTLGDNLTFFSSQFTQENAKNTGQKIGNGVLLVRSYAGNLNSFFSDLPISEVLFLYMILLVIVSVFRLIRQLIMLIKPL